VFGYYLGYLPAHQKTRMSEKPPSHILVAIVIDPESPSLFAVGSDQGGSTTYTGPFQILGQVGRDITNCKSTGNMASDLRWNEQNLARARHHGVASTF
jgi:hypothetical protein